MSLQETVSVAAYLIGAEGVVTKVCKVSKKLRVRVAASEWPAQSKQGYNLLDGTPIKVVDREGITLVVEPV